MNALPHTHRERLADLEFSDTDDALICDRRLREHRTAAYIVHGASLWENGPRCLSIFGMSGTLTFGFASVLGERWASELQQLTLDEIIVVEIVRRAAPLIPPSVQGFPDYWRSWEVFIYRAGTETALSQKR